MRGATAARTGRRTRAARPWRGSVAAPWRPPGTGAGACRRRRLVRLGSRTWRRGGFGWCGALTQGRGAGADGCPRTLAPLPGPTGGGRASEAGPGGSVGALERLPRAQDRASWALCSSRAARAPWKGPRTLQSQQRRLCPTSPPCGPRRPLSSDSREASGGSTGGRAWVPRANSSLLGHPKEPCCADCEESVHGRGAGGRAVTRYGDHGHAGLAEAGPGEEALRLT